MADNICHAGDKVILWRRVEVQSYFNQNGFHVPVSIQIAPVQGSRFSIRVMERQITEDNIHKVEYVILVSEVVASGEYRKFNGEKFVEIDKNPEGVQIYVRLVGALDHPIYTNFNAQIFVKIIQRGFPANSAFIVEFYNE